MWKDGKMVPGVTEIEKQFFLYMEVTCMFADREEEGSRRDESEE